MNITLPLSFAVLVLPLLTQAQYEGPVVRLDLDQPKPGQRVTVTYAPASTKLASASAVDGIVYWLKPVGEPIARDFAPTKVGDTYQATLTVPDSIQGLALVFENGRTKDRNNDQTYSFLLYDADGKPTPGSYASLSTIYLSNYYYVGREEKDPAVARTLMDKEIARNPAAKRQYMVNYLATFNQGTADGRNALKKQLDANATLPDLTRDEMTKLGGYYQQLGLRAPAEALTKRSEAKFGKPYDLMQAFDHFYESHPPLAQKKVEYTQLRREVARTKEASLVSSMPYMYASYLITLADSAQWNNFNALVKESPAEYETGAMYAYNHIAQNWAEKGKSLDKAAEWASQATEWAKNNLAAPRSASDYDWMTEKQLRENRKHMYGTYASTYGFILVQQGKISQATPYLAEAVKAQEYSEVSTNERYMKVLAQINPQAVTTEAERMITAGKSSKAIDDAFKAAYLKDHPDGSAFELHLARLNQKAVEHRKAELREKLISRPAPAFSLLNLEGKPVSLAQLKGKTVVVDFWATWCPPCIASFPGMQKAVNKFKADPNVAFVFIDCRQTETDKTKNAADFIAKKGYTFNVLLDETNEVYNAFGVAGIPTKFIIDKTGTIRFKSLSFTGNTDTLADEISMMIDLANEPVNE